MSKKCYDERPIWLGRQKHHLIFSVVSFPQTQDTLRLTHQLLQSSELNQEFQIFKFITYVIAD